LDESSDDDEEVPSGRQMLSMSPLEVLRQKNEILMDKLYQAEKKAQNYKDTMESIGSGKNDSAKDQKIIELAKKMRAMQVQME